MEGYIIQIIETMRSYQQLCLWAQSRLVISITSQKRCSISSGSRINQGKDPNINKEIFNKEILENKFQLTDSSWSGRQTIFMFTPKWRPLIAHPHMHCMHSGRSPWIIVNIYVQPCVLLTCFNGLSTTLISNRRHPSVRMVDDGQISILKYISEPTATIWKFQGGFQLWRLFTSRI